MKDGPQRVVAGIVRKPPLFLVAKPAIKTFADLKGANIGALSLTEGSSKLLDQDGAGRGADAPGPQDHGGRRRAGTSGLAQGRQDRRAACSRCRSTMRPRRSASTISAGPASTSRTGSSPPSTPTASGRAAIRSSSPGFVRALLRGQQFIFANPDEAAKIAAQVLKTPEPLAARAISEAVRLGILDPQLNWSELGLLENVREHAGRRHDAGGPQVRCQEGR